MQEQAPHNVVPFTGEKVTPLHQATFLIKKLYDAASHFNATKPSISRQLEMIQDHLANAAREVANSQERQNIKQVHHNRFFGALMGKSSASAQTELPEIDPKLIKELSVRIAAAEKALTDCGYLKTDNVFPLKKSSLDSVQP